MQDDPTQYRVPILKLSDILGEDGQNGTIEGTDTAVTGMSWHTVEPTVAAPTTGASPKSGPTPPTADTVLKQREPFVEETQEVESVVPALERTPVIPHTAPAMPVQPTTMPNVEETQAQPPRAPEVAPPIPPAISQPPRLASASEPTGTPKKEVIVRVQDVLGDVLDEPTPRPFGKRAAASIRATAVTQDTEEAPLSPPPPLIVPTPTPSTALVPTPTPPPISLSEPTRASAWHDPSDELPNFQLDDTSELPPVPRVAVAPSIRAAKDIDPLDIWDRPATVQASVVRKPVLVVPQPIPPNATPAPAVVGNDVDKVSFVNTEQAPVSEKVPTPPTPPTPSLPTDTVHTPPTGVVGGEEVNKMRDIWDTLEVGRRIVKPSLPKVAEVIGGTPPTDTPTPTPSVLPRVTPTQRVVEKPIIPSSPSEPAPLTQEASVEDLSELLRALVLDDIPPAVPVVSPEIPLVLSQKTVSTEKISTRSPQPATEQSVSPERAEKHEHVDASTVSMSAEPSTPATPLGTDLPDMWSTAGTDAQSVIDLRKAPMHTLSAPETRSGHKRDDVSESETLTVHHSIPHTPEADTAQVVPNKPVVSGKSNLSALRDRVMKESIGKPGEVIAPPVDGTTTLRSKGIAQADLSALTKVDAILKDAPLAPTAPGNTREPSTKHAQAISEIASKLGALTGTSDTPERTVPADASAHTADTATAESVSAKSVEGEILPLMRTFKQDVQQTVLHNKTSVVDMISSNEKRRSVGEVVIHKGKSKSWFTPTLYVLLGTSALLLIGAITVGVMVFLPKGDEKAAATYFTPDAVVGYDATDLTRDTHVQGLLRIRDEIPLRDGFATQVALQENILLPISGETETLPLTTHRLFRAWEIAPPDTLGRSLTDNYMFGYVSLDKNHPFLILESNYFQGAFSGMLDWERTMSADLDPLFPTGGFGAEDRNDAPRSAFVATTSVATTTPASPQPGLSAFEDMTIANVPARVLRGIDGGMLLVWSMPDNHIVITTNEEMLRRIIDRMHAREF